MLYNLIMKDNTKDLYTYKLKNRTIGGKGENLFKLGEYFGLEESIYPDQEIGSESELVIGSVSYNMYHHMINILATKYRIEGLPKHLHPRNFWKYFVNGAMIFFKGKPSEDDEEILLFSQYTPEEFDIFYDPIRVTPLFPNEQGNSTTLDVIDREDFVEVLFNPQRKSLLMIIGRFLSDLQWYYNEMKYDSVISRPFLYINGTSADDTIAEELNKQVGERKFFKQLVQSQNDAEDGEGNKLVNKLTSELNQELQVLQGKARIQDVIIPSLDIVTNYLFEFLGLNRNENKDKKERMVVDEVNINNETKRFATRTIIDSIQESFDEINEKFGTQLKVVDTEQEELDLGRKLNQAKEGKNNE